MKFLCLAYEAEEIFKKMPRKEWHELREETLAYVESLRRGGHLIATHALQSAQTASTVQVRNGKLWMTDGPFIETKEQLGGFFLIEAASFEEAIELAGNWPSARLGTIEVRPIEEELREEGRY